MEYMIDHVEKLKEMGERSKIIAAQYDEAIILDKTEKIYREALNL